MSHFTTVQTKIKCLVTLKKAVEAMGFALKEGVTQVRGYQGQLADAVMVIDTKSSYDIGVAQTEDGYSLIGDWEMLRVRAGVEQDEFMKTLNRTYAYHKVMDEVKKRGYSVVEEKTDAEQHVTVRVRKWG